MPPAATVVRVTSAGCGHAARSTTEWKEQTKRAKERHLETRKAPAWQAAIVN